MLGIVLSGTSVAGMILPVMMASPMMISIGWRPAMAVLSCGIWNHVKRLSVTRDFWLIFIGIFLVMGVDQSMLQNQVLFLEFEKGLNLEMVERGAALLAGAGILAKILFGLLFDRLSILGIIICYLLLALSVGLSFTVGGVATMLIFMTVRGVARGGLIIAGTVLLKHRYGVQNLGINLGILMLATSVGFGFCPTFMASMADKSGSYSEAFALGTIAVFVAAILLLPEKPGKHTTTIEPDR